MTKLDIEIVKKMGIHELRTYARQVGVLPKTMKQVEIIQAIQEVYDGTRKPEYASPTGAGRPPKGNAFSGRKPLSEMDELPENKGYTGEFCVCDHDIYDNDREREGVLEVHVNGYGFLRTKNYTPTNKEDVFVDPNTIKKYCLMRGDLVRCTVKLEKGQESSLPIDEILSINGVSPRNHARKTYFDDLTPCYPDTKIKLETTPDIIATRCIDLLCPIGKGQRGIIVSPPKAGKTTMLKSIAHAIEINYPSIELIVLLIDERPEEVTDFKRSISSADIVCSTFDESPEHHIQVAELVISRAKRLVEMGKDVVILLDSITKLTRAYNSTVTASGKVLSGGIDPMAFVSPKKFFGAARNIDKGGSLTILSTALIDTGSKMDDVIYEEFKGTGNMEVHLSRELSEKRVFPAIDIFRSGTRKEELLLSKEEMEGVLKIRKMLSKEGASENLIEMLKKTKTNEEFVIKLDEWFKVYNNRK